MRLRTKIIALAAAPLLLALVLVALAVWHQERDLAQRERSLIEDSYMAQRRSELRKAGGRQECGDRLPCGEGRTGDASAGQQLTGACGPLGTGDVLVDLPGSLEALDRSGGWVLLGVFVAVHDPVPSRRVRWGQSRLPRSQRCFQNLVI